MLTNSRAQGRSSDEVALELMKFIAVTTGYGKGYHQFGRLLRQGHKIL